MDKATVRKEMETSQKCWELWAEERGSEMCDLVVSLMHLFHEGGGDPLLMIADATEYFEADLKEGGE